MFEEKENYDITTPSMSLIKNLEKINIIWFKFWAVDFNNEKNYKC